MDEGGFAAAHLAGNSLCAFVALQLAGRGRAESVVALAPAGGWARDDDSWQALLDYQASTQEVVRAAAAHADAIVATRDGRRRATQMIATDYEHIPAELIALQMLGVARCEIAAGLIEHARRVTGSSTQSGSPVRFASCGAPATGCSNGPTPRHASVRNGCLMPTGSCSTASATARSSTCRSRPRSSSWASPRAEYPARGGRPARPT